MNTAVLSYTSINISRTTTICAPRAKVRILDLVAESYAECYINSHWFID